MSDDNVISLDQHRNDPGTWIFQCGCTNWTFEILGDGLARCASCGEIMVREGEEIIGRWRLPPNLSLPDIDAEADKFTTVTQWDSDPALNRARVVRAFDEAPVAFVVLGFVSGRVRSIVLEQFEDRDMARWLWQQLRIAWRDIVSIHKEKKDG